MTNLKALSVRTLSGVGRVTAETLENSGIFTWYDLLCRFPRTYEDHTPRYSLSETSPEYNSALLLRISSAPRVAYTASKKRVVRFSARLSEAEPLINIVFFNQPYLVSTFHQGEDWLFYGKVSKSTGGYFMFSPSYEKPCEEYSQAVPVYPASGIGSKKLAKIINTALDRIENDELEESLPSDILKEENLPDIKSALFSIHRPKTRDEAKRGVERFAFEELFNFALASLRLTRREDTRIVTPLNSVDLSPFFNSLPFTLTGAQQRVIREIEGDLTGNGQKKCRAMRRLLQGDVGSGKTAVAAAAMYTVAKNGAKSIIMAPTEILARQHAVNLERFFRPHGIEVYLLTGSTTAAARREIEAHLTSDEPLVLVGTHALFESGIAAENVRLVVTDEQHRFGVAQREKLLSMASVPNSLVMSATPIPRTLAMFIYAGLDISRIDEVPKGRQEIQTVLIPPSKKERMYNFIREELERGRQGYVICPLVEEDEENDGELLSAEETYELLSKKLYPLRVGLLHGKMKPADKKEVMEAYADHELDLLVSTTVIEVGIDVPNATVMAIENAERFGLAQLHQLRGRIGRGSEKSTCILITPSKGQEALERLSFMCRCRNGFEIAEYDLEKRGPGDFFGNRQHGDMPFSFAENIGNVSMFEHVMELAKKYENRI